MRCSCGNEMLLWQGFLLCPDCNRDVVDENERYEDGEVALDAEYTFQRMV